MANMKIIPSKAVFKKEEYVALVTQIETLEKEKKEVEMIRAHLEAFIQRLEQVIEIHPSALNGNTLAFQIDHTSDKKPILYGR